MSVVEFVEGSEFRKERARQLARLLAGSIGVDALLGGSEATVDDLLAVLADDLQGLTRQALRDAIAHAVADGFEEISEAEAAVAMRLAIERVLTSARPALLARLADLDAAVTAMVSGSSSEAVHTALGSAAMTEALLAPIAAVLAQTGAGIIQAVEADVRSEAVAQFVEKSTAEPGAEPPLLGWETREDDHVCGQNEIFEVSCSARHGKELTFEEWQLFGLPGDPDSPTICAVYAGPGKSRCRCTLKPAGAASATPVNISEAAKAGRDRALKEAA